MTMFRRFFRILTVSAVFMLLTHAAMAKVVDEARVTIECRNHSVVVTMVEFWLDDTVKYQDNSPGLSCTAGNGDSKLYTFGAPMDLNAFEFWYTCDNGPATMMHIPPSLFYFHIPLKLVCPSPGGVVMMDTTSPPTTDEAIMIVSDHDVLMWPGSECFSFRGGLYDYVCVTWYCPAPYDPVFQIFPGCSDPCGDPNCTAAQFQRVDYSAPCNPVPNIWCRLFWPVNLTSPGCWCYYFEYQLPVELSSFTAVPYSGGMQLRFTTASELHNDRFEILRSTDQNGDFGRIALMKSQGDATSEHVYTYLDTDVAPGRTYWYYLSDVDIEGHRVDHRDRMISATPVAGEAVPTAYALTAYPNPFNPVTNLEFTLPEASHVTLKVFDIGGRAVADLVDGDFAAGQHKAAFVAGSLPSGIYLARIEAGSFTGVTKLLLVK
jgi:hypothetical protein